MPPFVCHLRGVRQVVIDPRYSAAAKAAVQGAGLHPRPAPGTDLALGMLRVAVSEGYVDSEYVAAHHRMPRAPPDATPPGGWPPLGGQSARSESPAFRLPTCGRWFACWPGPTGATCSPRPAWSSTRTGWTASRLDQPGAGLGHGGNPRQRVRHHHRAGHRAGRSASTARRPTSFPVTGASTSRRPAGTSPRCGGWHRSRWVEPGGVRPDVGTVAASAGRAGPAGRGRPVPVRERAAG